MTQPFVLTIYHVKNCIAFDPTSPIFEELNDLCDTWYAIEKAKGQTDEAAAEVARVKLGQKVLEIPDSLLPRHQSSRLTSASTAPSSANPLSICENSPRNARSDCDTLHPDFENVAV